MRAYATVRLGPYELIERIGAGGMAEVFVARRVGARGFSKRFAVKRILPQLARDPRFVDMFIDEAHICSALEHPNIVDVLDFGEHDGELFMAMEFVDGLSAAKLLRSVAARGERFPLGVALTIVHDVLRALGHAHAACDEHGRHLGIVHRDVSPGNILLSRLGDVKLSDFGIVRSVSVERRTSPGELKGKLGYMSPEQTVGGEVDRRSDLFMVGIVLAEMLLARPLFPGQNELEILTKIYESDLRVLDRFGGELPKSVQVLLRRALARDPEGRFQDSDEFSDAVRSVAEEQMLPLDDTELTPWLSSLGVLPATSGTHEVVVHRRAEVDVAPVASPPLPRTPLRSAERRSPRTPAVRAVPRPSVSLGTTYRVTTSAGRHFGPLTLPQALELLGTGRIDRNSRVSLDGNEQRPLRTVPELAGLARRPAMRFTDELEARAASVRRIYRPSMPAILFDLVARQETGLLISKSGNRRKRVYFSDGAPVFVTSTDREELLGRRLVAAGLVSEADVERALGPGHPPDSRLGDRLVRARAIRPPLVLRAVVAQLEARFVELGRWTAGEMLFIRGELSGEPELPSPVPAAELIVQAVGEGYDDAEIANIVGPLRNNPLTRVPGVEIASLGLPDRQAIALGRAAGAASLEDLAVELVSGGIADPDETLRAVFIGLSAGILAAPGWPPSSGTRPIAI